MMVMMLNTQETIEDRELYFVIRKKRFFIGLLVLVAIAMLSFRYLLLHGLYIGMVPPPQPSPPLSAELVTRFNLLEDKLNKTINDVNEVFQYKQNLEKTLTPIKPKQSNDGHGGLYVPLQKLNFAKDGYPVDESFQRAETLIDSIHSILPNLKTDLTQAMLIKSNLPEGVPLVGSYIVSSGFGYRDDPFTLKQAMHTGVDFATEEGTPVLAAKDGRVKKINLNTDNSGFGNYVEISHPNDIVTLYGHLSEIKVSENQILKKGDLIGLVGSTGRSTGSHLHFEVQVAGIPVDPMNLVSPINIKPNAVSLSAIKSEQRAKCAPLLLIVKDENEKIFKDCLAQQGKNAKELLIARQAELSKQRDAKTEDKNALKDECTRVDSSGRLQTAPQSSCLNQTNKETSSQ
jgi:murein DD-endopeptidase MepM/ murein hydrolase activator NlpD